MQEKTKNFLQDNWFKIVIALVLIIFAISVFYYFVIIPKGERATAQQQKQEMEYNANQQKIFLDNCLNQAENQKNATIKYWGDWGDKTCKTYSGITQNNCLDDVLKEFEKAKTQETQDKNDCYKQYS